MLWFRRIFKGLLYFIGFLLLMLLILGIYVYRIADIKPPHVKDVAAMNWSIVQDSTGITSVGANVLKQNQFGLYEMYLEGDAYTRGLVYGRLAQKLIHDQELAFTNEIQRMIPSKRYLKFLKYVVGFMNRDLSDYIIH
jgi:hypothetical protein